MGPHELRSGARGKAVAAVVVMGRRKRARAEAAEKLIEMTGRGHEGSGPTEVIRIVPEEERFRW